MLQSSNVGYDRLPEAVLARWVDPTTASIGRSGKNKRARAGSGIREYESTKEIGGVSVTIGCGTPSFSNYVRLELPTPGPFHLRHQVFHGIHTIIFLGMHFFYVTSLHPTPLDIPWLVPHDGFG